MAIWEGHGHMEGVMAIWEGSWPYGRGHGHMGGVM